MFEDAVADVLIASNPYAVKRGELPAKIDKDPTWRSGAVFTREEVERLIWMNEFPKSAASFYAVLFVGGIGLPQRRVHDARPHVRQPFACGRGAKGHSPLD